MPSSMTLTLISYAGTGIAFLFSTLSLACGLYYLAELVEEYTVMTKKIIKGMTVTVVIMHLSLWLLDGFPFSKVLFSLFCHAVYSLNLANFPYISLASVPFIASCALVLFDHFMWFQFFSRRYYSFMSVASFFGICVWLIPFAYFISLSANDNALPSFDKTQQQQQQKKNGILKSLFGFLLNKKDTIIPVVIETPSNSHHGGLFSSNGSSSRPGTPSSQQLLQNQQHYTGTGGIGTGGGGYNPGGGGGATLGRPEYPISRPSSSNSNSNYSGNHGFQGSHGTSTSSSSNSAFAASPSKPQTHSQSQQQQHQHQYATSSAVYNHSTSTVGSRF